MSETLGQYKTLGEDLVRTSFNPSNGSEIDSIKQSTADLINQINKYGKDDRTTELAIEAYELAAMWAVKSLTLGK